MSKTLSKLTRIMEEFRKLDPEFPLQHAVVFLEIAREPGQSQAELLAKTGMTKSAMARITGKLSDIWDDGRKSPPLEVVEMVPGLHDARTRCAQLTAKGRRVLASLIFIVEA